MTLKRISGKFKIATQAEFDKVSRILPIKLAVNIEKHFRRGFESGGGQTDDSRGGWLSRNIWTEMKERKKAGDKEEGRGVLIKSGTLRRDIKQRNATFNEIRVGTSSITQRYADVHNSGLRSGRGKGFTMPKREFIGKSSMLEARNLVIIKNELKDLLI